LQKTAVRFIVGSN